jgi:hypothetical protein
MMLDLCEQKLPNRDYAITHFLSSIVLTSSEKLAKCNT